MTSSSSMMLVWMTTIFKYHLLQNYIIKELSVNVGLCVFDVDSDNLCNSPLMAFH